MGCTHPDRSSNWHMNSTQLREFMVSIFSLGRAKTLSASTMKITSVSRSSLKKRENIAIKTFRKLKEMMEKNTKVKHYQKYQLDKILVANCQYIWIKLQKTNNLNRNNQEKQWRDSCLRKSNLALSKKAPSNFKSIQKHHSRQKASLNFPPKKGNTKKNCKMICSNLKIILKVIKN